MKNEEKIGPLADWASLNREIMQMSEEQVKALLDKERRQKARLRVMLRLYHRLSRLRGIREKAELAQAARG